MSSITANRWQWTDGTNRNHIVQVVTASTTSFYTTGSSSMGTTSGYTAPPTSTSGLTVLTTTFQPKYSNSYILVKSSTIGVAETSNVSDDFRIFAHAGSTLLAWMHSGLLYFVSANNNQNFGLLGLYGWAPSWGTDSRTIRLGIDVSGAVGSYYTYNHKDVSGWQNPPVYLTITEIAA